MSKVQKNTRICISDFYLEYHSFEKQEQETVSLGLWCQGRKQDEEPGHYMRGKLVKETDKTRMFVTEYVNIYLGFYLLKEFVLP